MSDNKVISRITAFRAKGAGSVYRTYPCEPDSAEVVETVESPDKGLGNSVVASVDETVPSGWKGIGLVTVDMSPATKVYNVRHQYMVTGIAPYVQCWLPTYSVSSFSLSLFEGWAPGVTGTYKASTDFKTYARLDDQLDLVPSQPTTTPYGVSEGGADAFYNQDGTAKKLTVAQALSILCGNPLLTNQLEYYLTKGSPSFSTVFDYFGLYRSGYTSYIKSNLSILQVSWGPFDKIQALMSSSASQLGKANTGLQTINRAAFKPASVPLLSTVLNGASLLNVSQSATYEGMAGRHELLLTAYTNLNSTLYQ